MFLRVQDIMLELISLSLNFARMVIEFQRQLYVSPVIECVLICPDILLQVSELSSDGIDSPSFGNIDW